MNDTNSPRLTKQVVFRRAMAKAVLLFAIIPSVTMQVANGQLNSTQKADIGLADLQTELGSAMPTGTGISISQVEAQEASTNYRPDTTVFSGKDFVFGSGGSTGSSGHATTVGRYLYGPDGTAPNAGRAADSASIASYEVNGWLQADFLRFGSNQAPFTENRHIQNHSWIGSADDATNDTEILRRADLVATRDNVVMVYGLNNSVGSVPSLMSSAYNGIAVGRSDGNHSWGTTTVDGSGRIKPDLVVPTTATSWSTAVVSGAAAMLLEVAENTPALGNAARHEVVKALLMNGATKDEPEFNGNWNRTTTVPLDPVYGAGELNVQRSYHNLMAGQQVASAVSMAGLDGWDLGTAAQATAQTYFFEVPENYLATMTATLAWDRLVGVSTSGNGPFATISFSSTLANMDLALYAADGFALGSLLDESISTVDNVEHLFFENLVAGTYALVVSTDAVGDGQEYGFAWSNDLTFVIPEPSAPLMAVLVLVPALCIRRRDGRMP